jgi:chemotaxis protein CheX
MLNYDCETQRFQDVTGSRAKMPNLGEESLTSLTSVHVGSVGFVGSINGLVYLFAKTQFISNAAGKITGLEASELDHDIVSDVCGELTNIFGGGFKNAVADLGYDSMLTVPTVFSGDELFISTIGVQKHLRVEFLVNGEQVVADLVLAEPPGS